MADPATETEGPSGPLSGEPGPSGPLSGEPGPSGPLSGEPGPSALSAWSRVPGWAVASVWVLAATALQLVRSPDLAPWRALWAEDGSTFLAQALADPLGTLFRSHSGYLQVSARLVGTMAAVVPLKDAAIVFAVVGSLVVSILSVYVYVSSRSILTSVWARALLAASFVFASVTAFEVEANGLDLHWYLLFACFLALWSTNESTRMLVADSVVVALATLSGPLTVLYAPLALRRLVRGTSPRRWVVPGVYGVAAVCQLVTAKLYAGGSQRFSAFKVKDLPVAFGIRVTGSVLVGDRYLSSAWLTFGKYFAVFSVVVVGALCLYGLLRARGEKFVFIVVALAYCGLIFIVSLMLRGSSELRTPGTSFVLNGSRYTVVPVLLVIAVLVVIADGPALLADQGPSGPLSGEQGPSGPLSGEHRWGRWALAAFVALVSVLSYHSVQTVRVFSPNWRADVQAVRRACAEVGARSVHIGIAPGPPEDWYVVVPCDRVTAGLREWPGGSPPRGS